MEVILGSQSPRRKEILEFFSLPFTQVHSDYDEDLVAFSGDPAAFAKQVAFGKANALANLHPNAVILTADTVVYANNKLYLKPQTLPEARQMLREMAGKQHQVFTGVCVFFKNKYFIDAEKTHVEFLELTDDEIHMYTSIFSPLDKAGGYAIQKSGSLIVKRIEGCYYNVMGLPLQKVRQLLLNAGIDLWDYFKSV
jgi:septum formation protein